MNRNGTNRTDTTRRLSGGHDQGGVPVRHLMAVVEAKWPDIKEAFAGFDAKAVAGLGEPELDDLTQDKRLIRNRRKLEAIVGNARRMVDLEREHNGFGSYLRAHGGFEQTAKDLRKQFKFLGEHGTYYFLWVVGEEVPSYEEWRASRGIKPPSPSR